MKWKKWISACLALGLTVSAFAAAMPRAAAADAKTEPGLWLTEIYQNDRNRSGVFSNSSDQMEFVEVTNTAGEAVSLGTDYTLWYEYPSGDTMVMKQLAISSPTGSTVVEAGETVVLWSQRTDLGGEEGVSYASEAQFRQAMSVPEDVKVYRVSGQNGFAENDRGFALKNAAGEVTSYFHYNTTTDEVTADGLAVSLAIPDFGSQMQAFAAKKPTTAGRVFVGQLNGQRTATAPADLTPEGVYITEIRPNDSSRDGDFGSGSNDMMECLELYNTTGETVDLNQAYELIYRVKEDNTKVLPLYRLLEDGTLSGEGCTIAPNSPAVLWCYRAESLAGSYDRFPTEAEFRAAYGIADDVPVYVFTAQNGLNNTLRGFELFHKEADGSKTLVSRYFWDGVDDLKDNRSVELKVNPEGPEMLVYRAQATTNMGVVNEAQITYPADDGSSPTLTLLDDRTTVTQGDFLRIPYNFAGTDTMPVRSITLYYRTDLMSAYASEETTSFAIYNKWYAFIPSDVLLNAQYVDYYVKAANDYRTTMTEVRRVDVEKLEAGLTGLQVNFPEQETVSGQVNFTVKDFGDTTAAFSVHVDGQAVEMTPSFAQGAFFTFTHRGVDSYFKNALLCGDSIIRNFAKSSEIPSDSSMAIFVDQRYFTYQADGSATIVLEIWPGTYGSTWENDTEANNDDFYISDMALSTLDGQIIRPVSIVNENGDALALDAELSIGDSATCNKKAIMTFEIPAGLTDAMAGVIDTTTLADGTHNLIVGSSTGSSRSISFTVDNTAPQPEPEPEPMDMAMEMTLTAYPATAAVDAPAGTAAVEIYQAQPLTGYTVATGVGDSTISQTAAQGLTTVVSENGQLPYAVFTVDTRGQTAGTVRLDLTAQADYDQPVRLYALTQEDTWTPLNCTWANGTVTALVQLEDLVQDGQLTILAQARGAEYNPVTTQPATADTVENDYVWDGTGIPEQYDFAFAWISDTQYYAEQYMENFAAVTDWIVAEKDALGIEYVIHTGDIVDEFNEEYQFVNASEQLEKLENAGLPYGLLGGNHDVAHGNAVYDLYQKYFGAFRYEGNPWYGGTYDDNKGHYDLVNVDGEEFLFIYMSWDIYTPEVEWINSVLEQYPDRTAILCTHPGINATATPDYFSDLLLEEVCRTHPNVIAMLNGHYHGSALNFVGFDDDGDGVDDRVVYRICTDYQSAPGGGQGYIKMIYFDLANDKVYLNSYSPVLDDYNYYDTPKLDNYGAGTVAYDIDITELDVDFDRQTPKTLTLTDFQANLLGADLIARSETETTLSLGQTVGSVYAVAKDSQDNVLAYSPVQAVSGRYTIQAVANDGGSLSPEGATVVALNGAVTYTITPDEGYEIADVLVDGQTVGPVSTYTFTGVNANHTIEARFTQIPAPELPFADVAESAWYYQDVSYVFAHGLMNGVDETRFAPQSLTSRAMAAVILYRLEGNPQAGQPDFTDVAEGQYFVPAVAWAQAEGLVEGYGDGTFRPNQTMTRQELATVLYRYAEYKGLDVSQSADLSGYADAGRIQGYARPAMAWAVSVGLMEGTSETTLSPAGGAQRCQLAALLHRFDVMLNG